MTKRFSAVKLILAAAIGWGGTALAQGTPTATQTLELSVFGAATGTYTGLYDGRNAGITAGVDLSFPTCFHVRPSLEIRGNVPFDKGIVDGQKSVLFGPRISKAYGRFNPYIDGFFGRGEITYVGGFIVGNFRYDRTTTNVFAGGGGLDYRVTPHFDIKLDAQYERLSTPVISTGVIYAKPLSAGVVYHLDFNQYHRHRKHKTRPEVFTQPGNPN
jgi:hypothetical protein